MTARIEGWCMCGHHDRWHLDGGPCTYRGAEGDCRCPVLELRHVEVL